MAQVHALKFMRKGQIVRYQQVDHIICEKRVLSQCDNPFILSLAGTFNLENEARTRHRPLQPRSFSKESAEIRKTIRRGCPRRAQVCMLLELVPGGERFSLLRSVVRFEETQARTSTRPADPLARPTHLAHLRTRSRAQAMLYAGMVTCAFGYLHARKIAHRDLKPENLLFDKDGYLNIYLKDARGS